MKNAGRAAATLLPTQQALSRTNKTRGDAYRALLREALNDEDLAAFRTYLQQQRAHRRDEFRAMGEANTRRFAGVLPAHRPARVIAEIGK